MKACTNSASPSIQRMTTGALTAAVVILLAGCKAPSVPLGSHRGEITKRNDYDTQFNEAVNSHWHELLSNPNGLNIPRGRIVVLQFRLHYDGAITDMKVVKNSAG